VTFSSRTNRAYVAVSAEVAEATFPGGVAGRSRFQARRASRGLRRARDRRGRPGVTKSDLAELQVDAEIRAPLERVYPPPDILHARSIPTREDFLAKTLTDVDENPFSLMPQGNARTCLD
jgi:hypothetical protein